MRACLVVACGLALGSRVEAAPAADAVILWSPRPLEASAEVVAEAARRGGAAFVDLSVDVMRPPDPRGSIKRGIDAFRAADFETALVALDAAVEIVDTSGGGDLDSATLSDVFLYRGLTRQRCASARSCASMRTGDDERVWDDMLAAAIIDPTRILDPAWLPPSAVDQLARARTEIATLARARIRLVEVGSSCRVRVDGRPATDPVDVVLGRHWLAAECDGHHPVRRVVLVDGPEVEVDVAGIAITPPSDTELLIQGRTLGAHAIVIVIVRDGVALARRIGADGREQDRIAVSVSSPERAGPDIAAAVTRLIAPSTAGTTRRPWYRSPWFYAGVGAAVAGAILLPLALRGGGDPQIVLEPVGDPW